MRYGQVVLGPPGSGKSTYCYTLQNYFKTTGRDCIVINLDPANENIIYDCDINIYDLITLEDVMTEYSLGPNGALLFCMDFLLKNMKWLYERIDEHPNTYMLIDFPGQVELFTANDNIRLILQNMEKQGYRLCSVNLVDSFYCSNPEVFISAGLTSLITMINLELPAVNVLSKVDLITKYGDVDYDLDYYTELPEMRRMLFSVDRQHRGKASEYTIEECENDCDEGEMCDEELFVKQAKDPFQQRYRKLYWMLCDIVDDYGLLTYLPLDIKAISSIEKIVQTIDKANGFSIYDFVYQQEGNSQHEQNPMMNVFSKSDFSTHDMVDEMNEKYVHNQDDITDADLIYICLLYINKI